MSEFLRQEETTEVNEVVDFLKTRQRNTEQLPRLSSQLPYLVPRAPFPYPALMGVISSVAVVTLAFTVRMLRFMR